MNWTLTSAELNERIRKADGEEPRVYESGLGEKIVPYIGWYWRDVDFDRMVEGGDRLGVLPVFVGMLLGDSNSRQRVGFMENNKWGYGTVRCSAEEGTAIRAALEKAVLSMDAADFLRADQLIQKLIAHREKGEVGAEENPPST